MDLLAVSRLWAALKMTSAIDEAREVLIKGGDLVELAEAIGTIISDPASSLDDIRLGLKHGGIIAEQAAIELHRREGIPLPENRQTIHYR
jgi:hypothetical protein